MSDFTLFLIKSLNYNFVVDEKSTTKEFAVFRTNFCTSEDVHSFVRQLENLTNSNYNVNFFNPNMTRKLFRKHWVCRLSKDRKAPDSKRNTDCRSFIDITIKKISRHTKHKDHFLRKKDPLPCILKINLEHNHTTEGKGSLRKLRIAPEIKKKYYQYFDIGLPVPEARIIHESQLTSCYDDSILLNAAVNPTDRQLYYLYEKWKTENAGKICESFGKPEDVSNLSIKDLIPFINKNFHVKSNSSSTVNKVLQKTVDEDFSNKEITTNGQKEQHLGEEESNMSCSETVSSQGESITIVNSYSLSSNTLLSENVPKTFSELNKQNTDINFASEQKSFYVKEKFTFEYLLDNLSLIRKPNDLWGLSSHSDAIICARWCDSFTCAKRVVIGESLIVRVFLNEWEINLSEFMNIRCIEDISSLLEKIENFISCH